MYLQLLTYIQTRYRVIYYLVAIVGWYVAIASTNAGATTSNPESDTDTFDSDKISSSQIVDRSTTASRAPEQPPTGLPQLHDRGTTTAIAPNSTPTSLANRSQSPETLPQIDRSLPPHELTAQAVPASPQSSVIPASNQTPNPVNRAKAKPATILLPQSGRVAQVTAPISLPFGLPLPIGVPISLPLAPALSTQSTNTPINSILTPKLILPPTNTPAVPSPNAPVAPRSNSVRDPRYIVPPQSQDLKKVDPFSNQFVLNGNKVSHATSTVLKTGFESGNFRSSDLNFDIYKVVGASNTQSVTRDSVVRVETKIESVGVRSLERQRDIVVTVAKPQTLLGVRQQISLDADCLNGLGQICTFLPGITINESNLNRQLQPTGVNITSQFGDVLTPASVAAIREPGFQAGANGQQFGIDLNIPSIGLVSTPWSLDPTRIGSRREDINSAVAVNYTRMNQNFATNGSESVLGRTIRSANYINLDRNQFVNIGVQALGQVLPEFQPSIAPGKPGAKIVVNPNLYRAANAVRIPDNSQTVYQSGTGYAASRGKDPRVPPGASHNALWIGLSPVVDRELIRDYYYVTRRDPQVVQSGGGEGGSVPVAVNLNNFGFNSGSLQNAYGQGYVTVYNRNVDRYDIETLRQRTDYYPHISLTGASMGENSLWRYYTGAVVSLGAPAKVNQNIKAYVGTDYAVVNPRGLSFGVGGIGYLNPDPEYATQIYANANQAIGLGANPRNNLVLGVNANYIPDGVIKIQSLPVRSAQSFVSAGVNVNLGDVSVGGTQFFGSILPDAVDTKTVLNVGWKVTDRLNVGAFYTAADRNISTNPYGANLSFALDPSSNSVLYLGWNAAEIDFRRTLGASSNIYRDNTFTLSVRYGF